MDGATRELGVRLRDLSRSLRLIRQRRDGGRGTAPFGMITLLTHIDELSGGGCHGRELAGRTGLDPSTISRGVSSLVAQGLVERRADTDDGRAQVLTLTPAGRTALTDANGWYGDALTRALAGWTPDEVAALSTALRRFTDDLDRSLGLDCRGHDLPGRRRQGRTPHDNHDNLEAAR